MSNYKDRGIIKWAPFDALSSQMDVLHEMIYNANKKEKAILSQDEIDELNSTIKFALINDKTVSIIYYQDGYSYTTFGKIKKINEIDKTIVLDTNEEIGADNILRIKIER